MIRLVKQVVTDEQLHHNPTSDEVQGLGVTSITNWSNSATTHEAGNTSNQSSNDFLRRHIAGDWGEQFDRRGYSRTRSSV